MNRRKTKEYKKLREIVQKTFKPLKEVGQQIAMSRNIGFKTGIILEPKDIEALVKNTGKLLLYLDYLDKNNKLMNYEQSGIRKNKKRKSK